MAFNSRSKKGRMGPWLNRLLELPTVQRWVILLFLSLAISFLISPGFPFMTRKYHVGDVVLKDIKAPKDLLVEDWQATERLRAEAEKGVLPVYELDLRAVASLEDKIGAAFKAARMERGEAKGRAFVSAIDREIPADSLKFLASRGYGIKLEEGLKTLVRTAMERGVIFDGGELAGIQGITLRRMPEGDEVHLRHPLPLLGLSDVKRFLLTQDRSLSGLDVSSRAALIALASEMVEPNVIYDRGETERRMAVARQSVKPVSYQIKKGEMIIREGERVGAADLNKLSALNAALGKGMRLWANLGFGLLVFIVLAPAYTFAVRNIRKFPKDVKDHLFLALILFSQLLVVKVFSLISDALGTTFPSIPGSVYYYAIPFAAGAMLVRFIINSEAAVVFAAVVSVLTGTIFDNNIFFAIYTFIGSIVGAQMVGHCEQRNALVKGGFAVGTINISTLMIFTLVGTRGMTVEAGLNIFFGFLGGLVAAVVVTGITPLIELTFGYTSNIKLLELADLEHPLLKNLALYAPGTYHHSVVIGNLVEAAARAVGANPLLARVASYYHDVGKTRKPEYFIENLSGTDSKHEKLSPRMSSLIIISHVRDGLEMARQYKLGRRISDIIPQHHGTRLIQYFYHKALQLGETDEEDYRYPGPKPQTKEAGLVMLADAVEAASRTLEDPTPARIEGVVRDIINDIFLDGQLDECELTLRDLHEIAKSFTHTLTGIFHQRVRYPEIRQKKAGYGGDGSKPPEEGKAEPSEGEEVSRKDINRFRLS